MDENNINEHASTLASADAKNAHNDASSAEGGEGATRSFEGSRTSSGGEGNRGQESRSSYGSRQPSGQGSQRNSAPGVGGNKRGAFRRPFRKEKYDKIAAEKMVIDYKQPEILKRFLTERGKILSRYITGNSAKNQRRLVREVKRARFVGLLPSA